MDAVEQILLIVHFVGLASLLGGFLVQVTTRPRVVNRAMVDGALTQLVTGVLLVGTLEAADEPVNNGKVGTKLVVLLVILGLVLANRKKPEVSTAVWGAIGGLALLNIAIAVVW